MSIHPTAVVDPGAKLGEGVEVGPYAIIGPGVTVGDRCRIGPHACLSGPLEMGEDNVVFLGAAIGLDPQVKGGKGPWGSTRIGRRNVFREYSQVHRSMFPDRATVIGDDGYFMATAHVGHDCVVGDHVIFCNCALAAGHVHVGDRVFVSGGAMIHQFCRVGELAMVGGNSALNRDLAPFCMVVGDRPHRPAGLNVVGLRRAGVKGDDLLALRKAYRTLFRSRASVAERVAAVAPDTPEVRRLLDFVRTTKRGVIGLGIAPDEDDEAPAG